MFSQFCRVRHCFEIVQIVSEMGIGKSSRGIAICPRSDETRIIDASDPDDPYFRFCRVTVEKLRAAVGTNFLGHSVPAVGGMLVRARRPLGDGQVFKFDENVGREARP